MKQQLVLLAVAVAFAGCHQRETQAQHTPDDKRHESVQFNGGTLKVDKGQCDSVDVDELVEWADKAYTDARDAWPTTELLVRNLQVVGRNIKDYGLYKRKQRRVEFRCGWERVIRHELFHHWCYEHSLPCNCRLINHPPEDGGVTLEQCAP